MEDNKIFVWKKMYSRREGWKKGGMIPILKVLENLI